MYLDRIKIENFRGIRKLDITFEDTDTVLIGENHWGKTSLLRALWMVLGRGETLCRFAQSDLYVPVEIKRPETFQMENLVERVTSRKKLSFDSPLAVENGGRVSPNPKDSMKVDAEKTEHGEEGELANSFDIHTNHFFEDFDAFFKTYKFNKGSEVFKKTDKHIHIDLYFKEHVVAGYAENSEILKPYWYFDDDGVYTIHWQIVAFYNERQQDFITIHNLVNKQNFPFKHGKDYEKAFYTIIRLNPVLRLRDSRMDVTRSEKRGKVTEPKIEELSSLLFNDQDMSSDKLNAMMHVFSAYLDKYFAGYALQENSELQPKNSKNIDDIVKSPISLESLSSIKRMLSVPGLTRSKVILSYIASSIFMSKGDRLIDKYAKPILILEDIESRFHPSLLLSFWSILTVTDTQKIVTTNSGDLLSAVSLLSLRRLHRKLYDTVCYKITSENNYLSNDDLRRIAFHVRVNRPMVFFARTWILVEGETEVWIINQIASILGISLACEGIRIIEFAQCGLKPLMKLATQLGIGFHVLTDGDEAGRKYAEITAEFLKGKKKNKYLSVIPQKDIEHYFYYQGYDRVFYNAAGLSNAHAQQKIKGLNVDRIIDMAIKRKSKPGMALLLIDAIQKKGERGIPVVFANLLQCVRTLSVSNYY